MSLTWPCVLLSRHHLWYLLHTIMWLIVEETQRARDSRDSGRCEDHPRGCFFAAGRKKKKRESEPPTKEVARMTGIGTDCKRIKKKKKKKDKQNKKQQTANLHNRKQLWYDYQFISEFIVCSFSLRSTTSSCFFFTPNIARSENGLSPARPTAFLIHLQPPGGVCQSGICNVKLNRDRR